MILSYRFRRSAVPVILVLGLVCSAPALADSVLTGQYRAPDLSERVAKGEGGAAA